MSIALIPLPNSKMGIEDEKDYLRFFSTDRKENPISFRVTRQRLQNIRIVRTLNKGGGLSVEIIDRSWRDTVPIQNIEEVSDEMADAIEQAIIYSKKLTTSASPMKMAAIGFCAGIFACFVTVAIYGYSLTDSGVELVSNPSEKIPLHNSPENWNP